MIEFLNSQAIAVLLSIFPNSINFLLCNNYLLKKFYLVVHKTANLIKNKCNNDVYTTLMDYAAMRGLHKDCVLYSATTMFLFSGGRPIYSKVILNFETSLNPKQEYDNFINNKNNYINELFRHDAWNAHMVSNLSHKEYKYYVNGRMRCFPIGTRIGVSLRHINNNLAIKNASKFDATRVESDFKNSVSFHCLDDNFRSNNGALNARFCPGRAIAEPHFEETITLVVEKLKQHFVDGHDESHKTKDTGDNKLNCNSKSKFNNDDKENFNYDSKEDVVIKEIELVISVSDNGFSAVGMDEIKIETKHGVVVVGHDNDHDVDNYDTTHGDLMKEFEKNFRKTTSFKERCFVILHAISLEKTEYVIKNGIHHDAISHVIIRPEAFLVWFYFLFWMFSICAISVSLLFGDIDYDDNPLINTFGANNICIYYDFAPFSYFGTTLWVFVLLPLLLYEILDLFRIYDSFMDKQVSKMFYNIYTIATIFEIVSSIVFIQITATSPVENIWFHVTPYIIWGYALFSLALKRFVFYYKLHFFQNHFPKCEMFFKFLGFVHVFILLETAVYRTLILVPNMLGAKIWTIDGLGWTNTASDINGTLFLFTALFIPVVIFFGFAPHLEPIKIIINRHITHAEELS